MSDTEFLLPLLLVLPQPLSQASHPPLSLALLHPDFLRASLSSGLPKQLSDLSPQRSQAWPTTLTCCTTFSQDLLLLHQCLGGRPKDFRKRPQLSRAWKLITS